MAKQTARGRTIIRTWEVLRLLEECPRTLNELAARVGNGGVTTRTIRRDLASLEAAGFALWDDLDDAGRRRWGCINSAPRRSAASVALEATL